MSTSTLNSAPNPGGDLVTAQREIVSQQRMPMANQVFAIPELLSLISSFLSQGDAFRLAQCSHKCFHATVGYIWHNISRLSPLLDLLPYPQPETPTVSMLYMDVN